MMLAFIISDSIGSRNPGVDEKFGVYVVVVSYKVIRGCASSIEI